MTQAQIQHAMGALLSGTSDNTRTTYTESLKHFARWLGVSDLEAAVGQLLDCGYREANGLVSAYRSELELLGLSPATITLRTSVLRSVARVGRELGYIEWPIDV